MITHFVRIIDAAAPGNENPGFGLTVSGHLDWYTASEGDITRCVNLLEDDGIEGLSSSCNITSGGTFGGFEGDIKVKVFSEALLTAQLQGVVDIMGKNIVIRRSINGGEFIRRFSGIVDAWQVLDNGTFEITSTPIWNTDLLKTPAVTITKAMCAGTGVSDAVGKVVTSSYMSVGEVRLVPVSANKLAETAFCGGNLADYIEIEPKVDIFGNRGMASPISGRTMGVKALHVLRVRKPDAASAGTGRVFLLLGANGDTVLEETMAAATAWHDALLGLYVNVRMGTGSGSKYRIVSIRKRTIDEPTARWWVEVDTGDIEAFRGVEDDASCILAPYSNAMLCSPEVSAADVLMGAAYPGDNNVSIVSLDSSTSLFLVQDAAVQPTVTQELVTYQNGIRYAVPWSKIPYCVVSKGPGYLMIALDLEKARMGGEPRLLTTITHGGTAGCFLEVYNGSDTIKVATFADGAPVGDTSDIKTLALAPGTGYWVKHVSTVLSPVYDLVNTSTTLAQVCPAYTLTRTDLPATQAIMEITVSVCSPSGYVLSCNFWKKEWEAGMAIPTMFNVNAFDGEINGKADIYDAFIAQANLTPVLDAGLEIGSVLVTTAVFLTGNITTGTPTLSCYLAPSVLSDIQQLPKEGELYLKTAGNPAVAYFTPADIAKHVCWRTGAPYEGGTFADTVSAQRAMATVGAHFTGIYTAAPSDSVGDILNYIAKASHFAMFPNSYGRVSAAWFGDDGPSTPATVFVTPSNTIKGSLRISKPQNGYRATDFTYRVKKAPGAPAQTISINTGVETFPDEGTVERATATHHCTWYSKNSTNAPHALFLQYFGTAYQGNATHIFKEGTKWAISDGTVEKTATLSVTSPNLKTGGIILGFTLDTTYDWPFTPDFTIQSMGSEPLWKSYVSSDIEFGYLTAKNIWEHAKDARRAIGHERKAPEQTTDTSSQAIWGDDERAITQWIAYSTMHATRDKTLIKVDVPMISAFATVWLMDVAEVSVGPYRNAPTKGRIVAMDEDIEGQKITLSILTFLSDADVLIFNEQPVQSASLILEQGPADVGYSEGELA